MVEDKATGQDSGSNSIVSNEIQAIFVDHVINHGMTMTEVATMIQPNLRRSTVASIIRTFRNENQHALNIMLLSIIK